MEKRKDNAVRTSKEVASIAGKLLQGEKTSKKVRTVSASSVVNRRKKA